MTLGAHDYDGTCGLCGGEYDIRSSCPSCRIEKLTKGERELFSTAFAIRLDRLMSEASGVGSCERDKQFAVAAACHATHVVQLLRFTEEHFYKMARTGADVLSERRCIEAVRR